MKLLINSMWLVIIKLVSYISKHTDSHAHTTGVIWIPMLQTINTFPLKGWNVSNRELMKSCWCLVFCRGREREGACSLWSRAVSRADFMSPLIIYDRSSLTLSLSLIQAPCRSWIRPGGSWNKVERTSPMRLSPRPCAVRHGPPCWRGSTPTTTTPTPTTRTALHPPGRPNTSRALLEFTSTTLATGQVETIQKHTQWKELLG